MLNIVSVNYNTPELIKSLIESINDHLKIDHSFLLLNNGDKQYRDCENIDLSNIATKIVENVSKIAVDKSRKGFFASVMHAYTIDYYIYNIAKEDFILLVDTDVIFTKDITPYYNHILESNKTFYGCLTNDDISGKTDLNRLSPHCLFINRKSFIEHNYHFYTKDRFLDVSKKYSYDTGRGLYEDCRKDCDLFKDESFFKHYKGFSWKKRQFHILVATNHLETTGGTELYTYAMIEELKKIGFDVEYFTFKKGLISNLIENRLNAKFMSKNKYDLILANHKPVVDHLHKYGKIIQTCHGKFHDLEKPSDNADIVVSISKEVYDHLNTHYRNKKWSNHQAILLNGINLDTHKSIKPIYEKLTNVLSLCQSEQANIIIKNCCKYLNLNFTSLNKLVNPTIDVENIINENDLVIGIGRSAYDAIACGRPVISFDIRGYDQNKGDGYINSKNIENSIKYNLSGRFSNKSFDEKRLISELEKYDIKDGKYMREFAIKHLNIQNQIYSYLNL